MTAIVSNTGPLIALSDIGKLDLLQQVFGRVFIPPAVQAEVISEPGVSRVQAAIQAGWLVVQTVQETLAVQLLRDDLGSGESEAIILAQELKADWLVLDDLAARRHALSLGLPVVGTAGVMLMAKQAGYLAQLKPVLDQLRAKNFRMSDALYEQILKDANEIV